MSENIKVQKFWLSMFHISVKNKHCIVFENSIFTVKLSYVVIRKKLTNNLRSWFARNLISLVCKDQFLDNSLAICLE